MANIYLIFKLICTNQYIIMMKKKVYFVFEKVMQPDIQVLNVDLKMRDCVMKDFKNSIQGLAACWTQGKLEVR